MAVIETLTNFGDLAVLLPLSAVVALWLIAIRQPQMLLWWLVAVALCGGGTAVMKIYFFICPPLTDFAQPERPYESQHVGLWRDHLGGRRGI
ncbi:MAG TPA: hypothetical protein VKV32_00445 [Stellaceae bacterium]|nr:hypothetical protein [Stellaceae bacterium]